MNGIIDPGRGQTPVTGSRGEPMMRPRSMFRLALAALVAVLAPVAAAGDWGSAMRDAGEYTIYYNAVPASELDAWVAENYGLPQGEKRCVVTVAVIDKDSGEPVEASIMASATLPEGRMYKLDMRAVTDAGGRYYFGELLLESPGTVEFTLQVQPRNGLPPQTVRFARDFDRP